jgi:hypothetical protein
VHLLKDLDDLSAFIIIDDALQFVFRFSPVVGTALAVKLCDLLWQMTGPDNFPAFQEDQPFHGVSQFPDVARPVIIAQEPKNVALKSRHTLLIPAAVDRSEVVQEKWDVVTANPERRDLERKDVEPVVQVIPETLRRHLDP